ncbi:MAG: GNAT family N-acetyltransferase [Verrucomicrobiota bacterium]
MEKEPRVELIQLEPSIEESLSSHPDYFSAMMEEDWSRVAELVGQILGRTLTVTPASVDELQWGGYFVVNAETREIVGSCAFKGPPSKEGRVEIAYFTYPEFEGNGYATSMARKLLALAAGSEAIQTVIAHTQPEASASTRVLEKVGMQFVGEVEDPEDGDVWRWEN